jgi:Arc/MetJ-type ribon-helix-helix transcriptional regulator
MGRIDVRVPDEQERLIKELAGKENYGSRSEFVREAIRNEIRERIDFKQMREAKKRIKEMEDEEVELVDHEEVKEKAGIE